MPYKVSVLTGMIGDEIARRGRGAQTRLAEALGVPPQTVNKWVKGQTHPDPAKWLAIERHFEWDEGTIAMRVMPELRSDPIEELVLSLAEQVRSLADRVERLESRPARAGRTGS